MSEIHDTRLDPCPFCGHAPWLVHRFSTTRLYLVRCPSCSATLREHTTPKAVIEAWNTRAWSPPAPPPAPPALPWSRSARCCYHMFDALGSRPSHDIMIPHGPTAGVLSVIGREWLTTSAIAAGVGLSVFDAYDALNGLVYAGGIVRRFWCDHAALDGHYGCVTCSANPLRHEWRR
ncbi:MAG: restriction alleviation protein, Lar family [Tessaracoccus sp.]|uniref:Lar family restriction alleviation protein n=1 Tax=Tessaracoccus sp. TaxID=1971211 RepID=UPI001ED76C4D|nr:restriction alleviation protein, Lar family [Tessaracoccus sp.]